MGSSKTIFFSVGEPSGDLHGANLIKSIRSQDQGVRCVGYGGPKMQAAGCELQADLTQFAVMWIAEVVGKLPKFLQLLRQADQYFREHAPDAVVLIDYPGFNWWIARRAKRYGIPVFYYGAPQLWAWAGWRVHKLRRLTDYVLCKLPFEEPWFRQRGCTAHYIGHPYFDELNQRKLDAKFLEAVRLDETPLITLLPGSRQQEVTKNLPLLLSTADKIQRSLNTSQNLTDEIGGKSVAQVGIRLVVASFNESQATAARALIAAMGSDATVCVGKTPELIQQARCCLACSGSVSLELMHHQKPAVIVYVVNRFAYFLQNWFRKARYITLVNLLAADRIQRRAFEPIDAAEEKVPYPEFLTYQDVSTEMAAEIVDLLQNRGRYDAITAQLGNLKARFGQPGATRRAAEFILEKLPGSTRPSAGLSGPHQKPIRQKNQVARYQDS